MAKSKNNDPQQGLVKRDNTYLTPGANPPLQPGQIFQEGLANLSTAKRQELLDKAAEKALEHEVEIHEKKLQYNMASQEMDDFLERSRSGSSSTISSGVKMEGQFKTASGEVNIKTRSGGVCFVATAVYESPDAGPVVFLRSYRDTVLVNQLWGRKFISWYCNNGPLLARIVLRNPWLRLPCKIGLGGLVLLLKGYVWLLHKR